MTRKDLGIAPASTTSVIRKQDLDAIFPVGVGAWTAYTPTWTQSATITKTVNDARYTQVGKTVTAQIVMTATGSGTANNTIVVGLPVAYRTFVQGVFWFQDASAGATNCYFTGNALGNAGVGGSTIALYLGGISSAPMGLVTAPFTAAVATGDILSIFITYEAA